MGVPLFPHAHYGGQSPHPLRCRREKLSLTFFFFCSPPPGTPPNPFQRFNWRTSERGVTLLFLSGANLLFFFCIFFFSHFPLPVNSFLSTQLVFSPLHNHRWKGITTTPCTENGKCLMKRKKREKKGMRRGLDECDCISRKFDFFLFSSSEPERGHGTPQYLQSEYFIVYVLTCSSSPNAS